MVEPHSAGNVGKVGSTSLLSLLQCFRDSQGYCVLEEVSVSACSLSLEGGLGRLLQMLKEGPEHGRSLRVIECGANPACQEVGQIP